MAVVVEGPFDAIAVWQATGLPVVALGGKTLSHKAEHDLRKLVRREVRIMLDGNATLAAMKLQSCLMDEYECKLVVLEGQDDPADVSPDTIRNLVLGNAA